MLYDLSYTRLPECMCLCSCSLFTTFHFITYIGFHWNFFYFSFSLFSFFFVFTHPSIQPSIRLWISPSVCFVCVHVVVTIVIIVVICPLWHFSLMLFHIMDACLPCKCSLLINCLYFCCHFSFQFFTVYTHFYVNTKVSTHSIFIVACVYMCLFIDECACVCVCVRVLMCILCDFFHKTVYYLITYIVGWNLFYYNINSFPFVISFSQMRLSRNNKVRRNQSN